MNDTRVIPPALIAVGTGWDVSSHLSVPSDLLKRVTRERKYIIERIEKCSHDATMTKEKMVEILYKAREDLGRIGNLERQALHMARCRAAYIVRHVLSSHAYSEEKKKIKGGMDTEMLSPLRKDGLSYVHVLIQDYIARQGFVGTLSRMMEEKEGTMDDGSCHRSDLVDCHLYAELNQLVKSLEKSRDCRMALEWCRVHQSKLKKMQSSLMFRLHIQEFVQLLRLGGNSKENKAKAIGYAKTHLSPYAKAYPDDFQRAASLLVLRDILPESSTCLELFDQNRWDDLVSQLRCEFLTLHGLALSSPLETYLKAGIASLKTPESMHDYDNDLKEATRKNTSASRDNPLRHPVVHKMAMSLPYAKRTVSKLVCPVTGMIMEGANAPMVLPNGYVYGNMALEGGLLEYRQGISGDDLKATKTSKIQCPCTGDIFTRDDVRRAYIV